MKLFFTQMDPLPEAVRMSLARKGFACLHHAFRQVQWRQPEQRPNFEPNAVIVITSKNAARWFVNQAFPKPWPPFAVVGEATAGLLEQAGAWVLVPPAANAKALAHNLRQSLPLTRPLWFFHGTRVSPDLPTGLKGYQLKQLAVYETLKIVPNVAQSPSAGMVYFQAPSTVEDFVDTYGFRPELVAVIGPSTRKRVLEQGWSVDFQPSRPELNVFTQELPEAKHFQRMR